VTFLREDFRCRQPSR